MIRLARKFSNDERGVSAVILAVSLIGLLGAAVLAVDAGSAWATRRRIVTATDAGVLGAARLYSQNLADPCTGPGQTAGENEASTIMTANASNAKHDNAATPNGYLVTVADCSGSTNRVGHVRFDGRLESQQLFSGIFGFGKTAPISSSTAEFGWVVALSGGLRPIATCDQHVQFPPNNPPPNPLPPATGAGPFPHFALWNWLDKGQITQAEYDGYFGQNPTEYPSAAVQGINAGVSYLPPAAGGGVVHRINAKEDCGGGSAWRGWVDFDGSPHGSGEIADWLRNGYDGTVSLTPHDCGSGISGGDCDTFSGNHNANGVIEALDSITCRAATQSKNCFNFPIVLDGGVTGNSGGQVDQVAFLFVILRGYAIEDQNNPCKGNTGCYFDFEFVDVQADGTIGANPSPGITTPRGANLCGADHDYTGATLNDNRCNV